MSTSLTLPNTGQLSVFSKDGFDLVQRMAKAFSTSTLVPKQYQGEAGFSNCIIALNMAQRIGSDPLMTMQNLYVVHGTPAWSSQFLIATFNSCGRFSPIRYRFQGEEGSDSWGCRAVTTDRETGEEITGTLVTIKTAKDEQWYGKAGSKWKTMPEQMLRYRAAAWLIRSIAPEIAMGLHTAEEIHDEKPKQERSRVISAAELLGTAEVVDDEPGEYVVSEPEVKEPSIVEQYQDQIKECEDAEACGFLRKAIKQSKQLTEGDRKDLLQDLDTKQVRIEDRQAVVK